MKRTIKTWRELGKLLNNNNFKNKIIKEEFEDGKLISLTFETIKRMKK
ncbi:MAG TPA: hypothetical protein VI815_04065 [Candidatus Nanoarchaeia archaeon]|nr:hypothetical protein [Candidatus Nanoarchaeia archaeon]